MEKYPDSLHSPDDYIEHLRDTYEIAGETVDIAVSQYPGLAQYLYREEVALAGGLHDIGRLLRKDQLFHELRGAKYVEQHGLEEGIAGSLSNVYRIAQMFRPHYLVAEHLANPDNEQDKEEYEPLDSCLLVPRTWQEAIIAYADLSNVRGDRMTPQERINDIRYRYTNDPKYKEDTPVLKAMEAGFNRVLKVCERVEAIKDRKLQMQEVMRYGFL
jgi:hypothetical protein